MSLFKKKPQDINLIPEAEKTAKGARVKVTTTLILLAIVAVFIVVAATVASLSFTQGRRVKEISTQLDQKLATWQEVVSVAQKASTIKAKAAQVSDVDKSNQIFSKALDRISKNMPGGVKLSSVSIKSSSTLELQALSFDPAQIQQLVEKLKNEKDFFDKVTIASYVKNVDTFILTLDLNVKP